MNKKLIWILLGVVVIIVLLVVLKKAGVFGKEEGLKVSTEKAIRRDITEIVTASGKIYPEIEVKISPDIAGEIVELTVMEGDSVKKGQELAKIYADIYKTQHDQASALLNQQQAVVSNSAAQLPGLKATMDQAQKTFDREKQLLADKVVSQSEYDQAESALRTAQANYAAAQQSIIGNQAGAASARANLSIAAKNLYRATVYSPIDGVISLLSVKKGERVIGNNMMAGTEMMRVADMNKIEAIVDVGENDIPKISLGDSATVEVDAYNNRKFRGVVTQIASSVAATSTAAVTTNDVTNYKVHVRLNPETYKDLIDPKRPKSFPFRPGMSASADIQTNTHKGALSVPINAVTTRDKNADKAASDSARKQNAKENDNSMADNSKSSGSGGDLDEVVFILKADGSVKKVKVKTSIQDINNIEITDGLKEGDEVITGPYSVVSKVLQDGTKVQVVPKEKLFEVKKD